MRIKRIACYSELEKKELLNHWLHYYKLAEYSQETLNRFQELMEKDCDTLLQLAVVGHANNFGPNRLLEEIQKEITRDKKFKKTKSKCRALKEKYPEQHERAEERFLIEVVTTYNRFQKKKTVTEEELIRKIQESSKNMKLTSKRVTEVFEDCLFRDEEVKDGKPNKEFSITEGLRVKVIFNTERLNQHKPEINEMINEIIGIDKIAHFLNMCTRKDGTLWTGSHDEVDQLMMLGLATEILAIPLNISRDSWKDFFPDGIPFVIKNNEKTATAVVGNDPKDFLKVLNNISHQKK